VYLKARVDLGEDLLLCVDPEVPVGGLHIIQDCVSRFDSGRYGGHGIV